MNQVTRFKKIYVEISNICNLQCSFCPEVERAKKEISSSELFHTLSQIKNYTDRVCFHIMGEPLRHPRFSDFIELAHELGISIEITTNGTLLNQRSQKALLNPAVQQINFSIQSFFDNFANTPPDTYIKNILTFTDEAHRLRPDLYINFRLWNTDAENLQQDKTESFLRTIEQRYSLNINRTVDPRFKKSKKLWGRVYLHFDTRFDWPQIHKTEYKKTTGTCYGGLSQLAIHADGTVVPCCLDKEADIPIGNIKEQNFADILQAPRLLRLIQGFAQNKLLEPLCQTCGYANRFDKKIKTHNSKKMDRTLPQDKPSTMISS